MTIPAVNIPATSIPAATIRGVDIPGATEPAVHEDAVAQPAIRQEQVRTEGVCAQKVAPGEVRPSVVQSSTVRASLVRPSLVRPSLVRPSVCLDGDCIGAVSVAAVIIKSVAINPVIINSRSLDSKVLPEVTSRCVRVLSDRRTTVYDVCADVLFAFNRAAIRPAAERVLRQVADSLAKRSAGGHILIEGHTDSTGSPDYNKRLSLRRAEAVRRSLVTHGHISAGRITVRGYGESRPAATNADASGRARNRRVVIGVG